MPGGCFLDNATGPVTYDKFAPGNVFPNDPAHPHCVRLADSPGHCCATCQLYKNCSFWTWDNGGTAARPTCYQYKGACCYLKTAAAWPDRKPGTPGQVSGSTKRLPPPPPPPQWLEWPSKVPTGKGDGGAPSPFGQSADVAGFTYWTGGANIVGGTGADTWYPTWSADGSLYTTWTDGGATDSATNVHVDSMSCGPCRQNNGRNVTQGFARALPSKPSTPIESGVAGVVDVGTFQSSALPYQGRYPSGNLFSKACGTTAHTL